MDRLEQDVLVMGGGLAGLSAAHFLSQAGIGALVVEQDPEVGGLAKTLTHGPHRFDLGGHRFTSRENWLEELVLELLGHEISRVVRKSQILLRGRFIQYPLQPLNALLGLGATRTLKVALELGLGRLRKQVQSPASLEDWVVARFGRSLFEIYFRQYSQKVWGVPCEEISAEWVAQRIQGLSLEVALRNAFSRGRVRPPRTLEREFLYPSEGIGRIAQRLKEEINIKNKVMCGVQVRRILHQGAKIKRVKALRGSKALSLEARAFISTIPITDLVWMLEPKPPADVLRAAARLRFRDLVVVCVMLDMERATEQSWIYIPEQHIPFGRIHEPVNWSPSMAPPGKTHLVAEWFCFEGDEVWRASDEQLGRLTVLHLERLGFIKEQYVTGFAVVRVPKAYPLFQIGYEAHAGKLLDYLKRFQNLFLAGRSGLFRYYNMDHAMASGREAALRLMEGTLILPGHDRGDSTVTGEGA